MDLESNADKLYISSRILHISRFIPRETKDGHNLLFFHGGELDSNERKKILCHYSIFDIDDSVWLQVNNNIFVPQLKSHACSEIYDPIKKEFHIIITGGIYKEHLSSCGKTNYKEKEDCACSTDLISDKIYAYRKENFSEIQLKNPDVLGDRLKRFGHSMVTASDGSIYMICGFAQYIGYIVDMIKLKAYPDTKNKSFYFEGEGIHIGKQIKGRIYSSINIVNDCIIMFGGIADDVSLNDLWIINLKTISTNSIVPQGVEIEKKLIYPRFGMSSHLNIGTDGSTRLLIFGGSYWCGDSIVYGMTNEIIVFKMNLADENIFSESDCFKMLPSVYGKGSRRLFHQSIMYKGCMYVFGGFNNLILKLRMPDTSITEYKKSVSDYLKECNTIFLKLNPISSFNSFFRITTRPERLRD